MIENYQDAPVISPDRMQQIKEARSTRISLHYPDIQLKTLKSGMVSIHLNETYSLIPMSAIDGHEIYNRLKTKLKLRHVGN